MWRLRVKSQDRHDPSLHVLLPDDMSKAVVVYARCELAIASLFFDNH